MNFDDYADSYCRDLQEQETIYGFFASNRDYFIKYKIDLLALNIDTQPKTILDFGCGIGLSLPYFKNNFPKANISATDISESSLSMDALPLKEFYVFSSTILIIQLLKEWFHHVCLTKMRS